MDVPSFLFLAFAAAAALAYSLSRARRWRMAVLFVTNIVFLLSFSAGPWTLLPFVGLLLLGFLLVRLIGRGVTERVFALAIVAIVVAFVWLKRYSFIPGELLPTFDYATVGMSYVFFRILGVAIAARDEPAAARISAVGYVNYTLNFTSLVSGPIQKFEDYDRMTGEAPASLTLEDAGVAVERIIAGMFQFTVMATLISVCQHSIAESLAENGISLWEHVLLVTLLVAVYPLFLFFNFSGYTSFVIGVARFFRIELPENFNRPFRSTSFIDYWSRWHITLSDWLKAHVYNPILLGAARRVSRPDLLPWLNAGALFITFFLIGVWHGRNWHFVFFGLLNGGGVMVNQFYRMGMQRSFGAKKFLAFSTGPTYQFLARGVTFSWVAFTLLWFWSDWPEIGGLVARLGPVGVAIGVVMLVLGSCIVIAALEWGRTIVLGATVRGVPLTASPYLRTVTSTLMLMAVIACNVAMAGYAGDVVYKEF